MTMEYKKRGRKTIERPDDNTLIGLYRTMTGKQIAEQYKCSLSTVYGWIADIRRRQKEEV